MKLDKDVEKELWLEYEKDRNNENRNNLVVYYNPLVNVVIAKLGVRHNKYIDYDDLLSYGALGLIEAVEKFDSTKGAKFQTYASIKIRGKVLDHFRKQDILPANVRHRIKKVEEAMNFLEATGISATEDAIARHLDIDVKEVNSLLELSNVSNMINLDDAILMYNDNFARPEYDPEYRYEKKAIKEALINALGSLNEKEQLIVSLYYYDNLTLKEIGSVLTISESRVCQIHSRILTKLRAQLEVMSLVV